MPSLVVPVYGIRSLLVKCQTDMKTYISLKRKFLEDPVMKEAYDALAPEYALSEMIIRRRIERGLTQRELKISL